MIARSEEGSSTGVRHSPADYLHLSTAGCTCNYSLSEWVGVCGQAKKPEQDGPLTLPQINSPLHCKKRSAVFPSPAGMCLTKRSLAGNNENITGQGESLVSDIPSGDVKFASLFLQCMAGGFEPRNFNVYETLYAKLRVKLPKQSHLVLVRH